MTEIMRYLCCQFSRVETSQMLSKQLGRLLDPTTHHHLNSIGHKHLHGHMMRPTCLPHQHCLITPHKAQRDLQLPILPHTAMLRSTNFRETPSFLSQAQSSTNFHSFCFKDVETVFTVGYVVEPGSLEAHRGWIVDKSYFQVIASTHPATVQDGFILRILLGARA